MQTRLILEIVSVLGLLGALGGWWHEHNKHEQTVGMQTCVSKYTETVAKGSADTDAINAQHAQTLKTVVDTYDAKLKAIASDNDDLAQRLHDIAAADGRRAVPSVPAAARAVCPAPAHTGLNDRDRREAADLEACAANTAELMALREAWAKEAAK
jgi:hypothetical protein